MSESVTILTGDCIASMRTLPDASVHCCVTSPPYYGLRSYMPKGVRIKSCLPPDKRREIEEKLAELGIFPVEHT